MLYSPLQRTFISNCLFFYILGSERLWAHQGPGAVRDISQIILWNLVQISYCEWTLFATLFPSLLEDCFFLHFRLGAPSGPQGAGGRRRSLPRVPVYDTRWRSQTTLKSFWLFLTLPWHVLPYDYVLTKLEFLEYLPSLRLYYTFQRIFWTPY